jgi:hypothetical protein
MDRSNLLLVLAVALLVTTILAVAVAHESYLLACVCVVNSISRGAVALGTSIAAALVPMIAGPKAEHARRVAWVVQLLSFVIALFFLIQHVFFALELA